MNGHSIKLNDSSRNQLQKITAPLKIAIWNSNGLCKHALELRSFIYTLDLDILLISETHFTSRSYITIPQYDIHCTNHPDEKAHGGSAVIIKHSIQHYERAKYELPNIQATSVTIADKTSELTVAAVYCPPRHNNKQEDFTKLFKTLGNRFLIGGDLNAKNTLWGSRITSTKGRELLLSLTHNNLQYVTTREPTYWPTDPRKTPDLLDICITKGISPHNIKAMSCLELTSDHTPILITIFTSPIGKPKKPSLSSNKTNWNIFRLSLDNILPSDMPLKSTTDIEEAVTILTQAIQKAAWTSTPDRDDTHITKKSPVILQETLKQKRRARKRWQTTRSPADLQKYRRLAKELKQLTHKLKNEAIQDYLRELTPTKDTNYSLWKATRKLKHPKQQISPLRNPDSSWARTDLQKATTFAHHLCSVFKPYPSSNSDLEKEINPPLTTPTSTANPLRKTNRREVENIIQHNIKNKKAPGYDLITGEILKNLTNKGYTILTQIYNAIIRLEYFPCQWKVAQVIMILKPGKNPAEVTSYRPISLLPILAKILEKIILSRLQPLIDGQRLIPSHQFGFRKRHGTLEQIHRIVQQIENDFENNKYCSAVCVDISQAFDKVWHIGLLHKLKNALPHPIFSLIKSYLTNRTFQVKHGETYTDLYPVQSGVPQGSILGPVLYSLYTADLPLSKFTTLATYADDTTILASHKNPVEASRLLQTHLNKYEAWLQRWRIKANETKSAHITFTLKTKTCPPVLLNGTSIPQSDSIKYLGLHLDRRLTWRTHILTKRHQLNIQFKRMYWLLGRKSELTTENKLLLYETILKPIWSYGAPLWGTASTSNIEILQRFQNKVLRTIVNAPWYVPNKLLHSDLRLRTIPEEINHISSKYNIKIKTHPNRLAAELMNDEVSPKRLKRLKTAEVATRYA
jgi:endonuclease/exonuclease/phosphatase family metal-dependent hydrolase